MAKTKKLSISVVKGRGCIAHNNREFISSNVDQSRSHLNITYKKESLEEAYQKVFGKALQEYNARQTRSDRIINDYLEHILNSKNGEKSFYEIVVQVGNKQDCPCGSRMGNIARDMLDKYMCEFEKNNPNLYVFNAVLHDDEATPHLHIDYIPIATGYKNGMSVRNSLDRALKQQGCVGKSNKYDNATHTWQEHEKNRLETIISGRGYERAPEKSITHKHYSVEHYKTICEVVENQINTLPKRIAYREPKIGNKDRVMVSKEELMALEKRAKLSVIHEKAIKQVKADIDRLKDEQETIYAQAEKERTQILQERFLLEREREKIEQIKSDVIREKRHYQELSVEMAESKDKCDMLTKKCEGLERENSSLRSQISYLKKDIEEHVNKAISPLKAKLSEFSEQINEMVRSTLSFTNAISYIKENFEDDFLYTICASILEYGRNFFSQIGYDDIVESVDAPELSEEIQSYLPPDKPDYPEKLIYKNGRDGYGFYDKNGSYWGDKSIYTELKELDVKISDPYDKLNYSMNRAR